MNSFKCEIIKVFLIVLIMAHDSYGGIFNIIFDKKVNSQCEAALNQRFSYKKRYVEIYYDIFRELTQYYNPEFKHDFAWMIEQTVSKCKENPYSILTQNSYEGESFQQLFTFFNNNIPIEEDIRIIFFCDVLINVQALTSQKKYLFLNAEEWCIKNAKEHEINYCIKSIEDMGFTFKNGHDNRVIHKLMYSWDNGYHGRDYLNDIITCWKNGKEYTINPDYYQYKYYGYLEERGNQLILNTRFFPTYEWCQKNECDPKMRNAYKDQHNGSRTYCTALKYESNFLKNCLNVLQEEIKLPYCYVCFQAIKPKLND